VFAARSFRSNQENERGALFRLGRLGVTKGLGLDRLVPLVDRVVGVEMRTLTVQLDT
jgi:regulator of protease activity HflC (stomatin/prohibitin superfamily)